MTTGAAAGQPGDGTPSGPAGDSGAETGAAVRFPFPPLLFAAPLVAALALQRVRPWNLPLPSGARLVGVGVVAAGAALAGSGGATFRRHGTTVVPHHVVSALVTDGPYRLSRNPMYTGLALVTAGTALWSRSWWPLAAMSGGVLATQQLVIRPEEEYLAARFGADYDSYRSRVRRWL